MKSGVDRVNGYNDSYFLPFTWYGPPPGPSDPTRTEFVRDPVTDQIMEAVFLGDGKDAFGLAKNNPITPWSNPNTQNAARQKTWISIEVINESVQNGTITLSVSFDSLGAVNAPPSKPQDLRMSTSSGHPQLSWSLNQEPDVNPNGNYLIHRRIKHPTWSSWTLLATVSGSTSIYVDESLGGAPNGVDSVQYKIQAKDTQAKLSVFSNTVTTRFNTFIDRPTPVEKPRKAPDKFELAQNYPNPSNPVTVMRYQVPVGEHLTIQVLDILGKKVETLVDGFKEAGYYAVTFDASQLATGVYFYRMTAGEFAATMKLAVVK